MARMTVYIQAVFICHKTALAIVMVHVATLNIFKRKKKEKVRMHYSVHSQMHHMNVLVS